MRRLISAVVALWLAGMAAAQDAGLATLQTGDDARGWEAVGRIDIDGRGFCTGALISETLVLTAAHCLFDRDTGAPIPAQDVHFLAGYRNGRALAYRDVSRIAIPQDYAFEQRVSNAATRHDLALLQLSQPIRLSHITPFATASAVQRGESVGVVSYAHNRADAPRLERLCDVLGTEGEVIVLSCDVDYGSSGSPIFTIDAGMPRIVSVVSAKATLDGQPVALGTALQSPLAALLAQIETPDGTVLIEPPGNVRVISPGERVDTGARFIGVGER